MSAGDQDYTTGMRNPINKDQFAYLNMEIKALESERDRLKVDLAETNEALAACQAEGGGWKREADRMKAELEAAETCIDDHRGDCLEDVEKECSCGYSDKLKAWRRAKGELNDSEESKGE